LTVYRDGAETAITVTVRAARLAGLTAGAIVDAVEPGGWAALARLGTGDVITEVDGQPINDVEALERVMKAAASRRQPSLVLRVRRGVRTAFVEIEPAWPK
jgi:S1-C subfamily serine protease